MISKAMHPVLTATVCPRSLVTTQRPHFQFVNNDSIVGKKAFVDTELISTFRLQFQFEHLTLILAVLIVVRLIQTKLLKSRNWIDNLPGPKTYPVVGGLLYFSTDLTKTFKLILDWSARFGPIFRGEGIFNEPYIFLSNVQHVQAILTSNQVGVVSKPRIPYDSIFGQFLKNGLLVSEGAYWKSHRRTLSRAFTFKSFFGYTKIFNQYSKRLVSDLEKLFPSDNLKPTKISDLIHCCSLQIVCASVMGLDLSDSKEGILFYEKFQRYKVISSQKTMHFWLLIDFIWKLHPMSREYNEIIDLLNSITRKTIENRSNNNIDKAEEEYDSKQKSFNPGNEDDSDNGVKPCRNMIDEMLASNMTSEEILVEANTVIAAGFESTSLTIQYMLLLLALNPEHQRACQEEIDEVFNDPVRCVDGNLAMDALSELKYLERCSLETLRLFPVIFLFQRKPNVPVKLDDNLELPAGTNVIISPYVLHRNSVHFPEPEKFDPDRFLPENCQKRSPFAFIPFSAGMRNCIGYKFALLEIKAVVAHVLRNFEVFTVDKIEDVPILPSIVMTPMRDYMMILKRRVL